jgi:hypothetical protein
VPYQRHRARCAALSAAGFVLTVLLAWPGRAVPQEPVDTGGLRRIREEAYGRSAVLETALGLSDLAPPRLAGSPGYLVAAGWARDRLRAWGVSSARLEPWGRRTAGWVLDRYVLEMIAPWYLHLTPSPEPGAPRPAGPSRVR